MNMGIPVKGFNKRFGKPASQRSETIDVKSDDYQFHKAKYDMMGEMMGKPVNPVDAYGSLITQSKNDPTNLSRTQENIRKRFGMQGKDSLEFNDDRDTNGGDF
jgi:hypothetical protein